MKNYQFKTTLFEYFNEKMIANFPELSGKIFRNRLKINKPDYPYVVLKCGERKRINKRFETFYSNNTECVRAQYRIPVTFRVYDLKATPIDAEMYVDNIADYIETFFKDNPSVHTDLANRGIVINNILSSGVKDLSEFLDTNQEFIREIDIVFEFEDLIVIPSEEGKELNMEITAKD